MLSARRTLTMFHWVTALSALLVKLPDSLGNRVSAVTGAAGEATGSGAGAALGLGIPCERLSEAKVATSHTRHGSMADAVLL